MSNEARRVALLCIIWCSVIWLACGCTRAKPPKAQISAKEFFASAGSGATGSATGSRSMALGAPGSTVSAKYPYPPPDTATPTASLPVPTPSLTSTPPLTPEDTATPPATTATATPQPTQTLPPSGEVTYVVVAGDTLISIAARHNTTALAIANRNGLGSLNVIRVGQELIIPVGTGPSVPGTGPSETPPTYTVQHTVVKGETLSQLSRRYRTTVKEILAQNDSIKADPDHVKPGTVLTITVGTAPPVLTHTVRPGENLASIARRYRVSLLALVQANALPNPNRVMVGQILVIPR